MDSRNINKNRRQKNKNKKPYSWKIINQLVESTSDQDSDGTTGSIGGERIRDSSQCSTNTGELSKQSKDSLLPIVTINEKQSDHVFSSGKKVESEKKTTQPSIQNGEKKKKRGRNEKKLNYVHKNNEKVNSIINVLLVAALLIVSGLASGHYIGSQSGTKIEPTRVTTTILNRYVNKTIEMYQKILDENKVLREKIQTLESLHCLGTNNNLNGYENQDQNTDQIEHIEKDIIREFIRFIEKEMILGNKKHNIEKVVELNDDVEQLEIVNDEKESNETPDTTLKNTKSFSDYQKDEDEFKHMIEKGKLLQRRLKRKKLIKDENIAKHEKVKNNQEVTNGKDDTFANEKERTKETLIDADHVAAACKVCSEPNLNREKKRDTSTHSTKYKINNNNKSGYVNNIRKLFEPDSEACEVQTNEKTVNDAHIKSVASSTEIDASTFTGKNNTDTSSLENKEELIVPKPTQSKDETSSILDNLGIKSSDFIGPVNEIKSEVNTTQVCEKDADKCYSEEFELESQYINDTKADNRNSKRKYKNRANEGGYRNRKKVKHQRTTNELIE